jgi:hypothetical protein
VGGLFFVCTLTDVATSPSVVSAFLSNLTRVIKDFCGAISEGALRANFALVYEVLDEVIVRPLPPFFSSHAHSRLHKDFGFIQDCSSEQLKPLINNVAVATGGDEGGVVRILFPYRPTDVPLKQLLSLACWNDTYQDQIQRSDNAANRHLSG